MIIPASAASTNGRRTDELEAKRVGKVLRNNMWLIAACVVVALGAAALYIAYGRVVYRATTMLRVDDKESNVAVLDMLQSLSSGNEVATEVQVVQTYAVLGDVVDSLKLQVTMTAPRKVARDALFSDIRVAPRLKGTKYTLTRVANGQFSVERSEPEGELGRVQAGRYFTTPNLTFRLLPAASRYDRIVLNVQPYAKTLLDFRNAIKVRRPDQTAKVILVTYESSDPYLVYRVPDAVASSFIRKRQEVQKRKARSTVDFLNTQIDTLAMQLSQAEETLKNYREGAQVVSLEAEGRERLRALAELQGQRTIMNAERESLAKLLDQVQASPAPRALEPSPYRRLIAFPSLLRNAAAAEMLRSLAEVEDARAELLNRRVPTDPDVMVLTTRIQDLDRQLQSIALTYLQGLTSNVRALDEALAGEAADLRQIPAREIAFVRLNRQKEILEDLFKLLQTRLKEAQIMAAIDDASVHVVDPALAPYKPVRPQPALTIVLATFLGLVLGTGAAFGRAALDTAVRTKEDVQTATGIPVIGMIPKITAVAPTNGQPAPITARFRRSAPTRPGSLVASYDPHSPSTEAYRALRTNLTFASLKRGSRTILFTSALPGDGKTTTAANLAMTLAQQRKKVLLIDADMRRGTLHEVFRIPREPGLSNTLFDGAAGRPPIVQVAAGESTIDVLPGGTVPPNPAELLGSDEMKALLNSVGGQYDMIVLDTPPMNLVTDAAILGTLVDAVVVVTRSGVTPSDAAHYAVEQLKGVGAPVVGAILNDFNPKQNGGYYGSYKYAYR